MLLWTKIAAIGQVTGAIATAAAVLVSLWLAGRAGKIRVKISATIMASLATEASPSFSVIMIRVTNLNAQRIKIAALGWSTGWFRRGPTWLRAMTLIQGQMSAGSAQLPYYIEPMQDEAFFIRTDDYRNANSGDHAEVFKRKFPWLSKPRPANIRVLVSIVGADDFLQPVSPSLRRFLAYDEL